MVSILESATPPASDISRAVADGSLVSLGVLALFIFLMFLLMIIFAIVNRPRDTDDHDG